MKIHEENQFSATQENVGMLLSHYDLALVSFETAKTGIENSTLLLNCNEGKFVLRIYRQEKKSDNHIHQELEFVAYLHERGIKVAAAIPNKEGGLLTVVSLDNRIWQVILMEFLNGENNNPYAEPLLKNMATNQAKIHILSSKFESRHKGFAINHLKETKFIKNIDLSKLPDKRLPEFLERAARYHIDLDDKLPRGLCHLDYDKDNILSYPNGDIAAILDFDDLADAPYIVDLAYTLWHILYFGNKKMMSYYLLMYKQERPLTELEKSYIRPIMLFRHYVICSIFIIDGGNSVGSIDKYLALEENI